MYNLSFLEVEAVTSAPERTKRKREKKVGGRLLDGNGEIGGKCCDKGQSCASPWIFSTVLVFHEKIHTLLAQECPGRAVLSAPGFLEPPCTVGWFFCLSSVLLEEMSVTQETVSASCCF